MLEALKFVQRGVARRDYVPGLTHFRIENGRCTGYNGTICLSAPVDIGFNVAPIAALFIKALDACEEVITLQMDGARLIVRSGNFRTAIPCIPLADVPAVYPEGNNIQPHGSLLDAFTSLNPFIGTDASRPWAMGCLLSGQSAYATNNAIVTEYWLGTPFAGTVNVPANIIEEVVRVKEELVTLQIAGGSITFHYADGRWIKTQLLALDWPNIVEVLDASLTGANFKPVPHGLLAACDKLITFTDKHDARVFLRGTDVATRHNGIVDEGALIELPTLPERGCYNVGFLRDVLKVATQADFTRYPQPVPFLGNRLRGALCAIRDDV